MERQVISIVSTLKLIYDNFTQDNIKKDLEKSIEDFGIDVQYSNLEDEVSGYSFINKEGQPVIVVNGNHHINRRRFTMAHELGHAILHWKWLNEENQILDEHLGEVLYRRNSYHYKETKREKEANMFAAELLAPLEEIKEILGKKNYLKMDSIEKEEMEQIVSKKYSVSPITAQIQLKKTSKGLLVNEQ